MDRVTICGVHQLRALALLRLLTVLPLRTLRIHGWDLHLEVGLLHGSGDGARDNLLRGTLHTRPEPFECRCEALVFISEAICRLFWLLRGNRTVLLHLLLLAPAVDESVTQLVLLGAKVSTLLARWALAHVALTLSLLRSIRLRRHDSLIASEVPLVSLDPHAMDI